MISADALMANTTYTVQKIISNGEKVAECLALYDFYYYTAKRQKTNRPWATVSFCAKGLQWSREKVRKVRKILLELGLIKDIHASGQIQKAYVQLNYITKKGTVKKLFKNLNAKSVPVFNSTCNLAFSAYLKNQNNSQNHIKGVLQNAVVPSYFLGSWFCWGQQNVPQMLKEYKDKCLKTKKKNYTTYNTQFTKHSFLNHTLSDVKHIDSHSTHNTYTVIEYINVYNTKYDTYLIQEAEPTLASLGIVYGSSLRSEPFTCSTLKQHTCPTSKENACSNSTRFCSSLRSEQNPCSNTEPASYRKHNRSAADSNTVFRDSDSSGTSDVSIKKKRQLFKKMKLNPLKSNSTLNKEKHVKLSKTTIELIEYWNSKESLPTHKLKYKKNGKVLPKHQQTKLIQRIDSDITSVLRGTFYKNQSVAKGYQIRKYTVDDIKKAIDNVALMFSPGYPGILSNKKVRFNTFFHNPHTTGSHKYTHPFLYYLTNTPAKLEDDPIVTKTTQHQHLVSAFLVKIGISPDSLSAKQYNKVANNIAKAVRFVRNNVKMNPDAVVRDLPQLLCDTMENNGIERHIDKIPLVVYSLSGELRKRLYIS